MVLQRFALFTLFFVFFIGFSSANFVCGEITSEIDYSPSWMNVLIYYEAYPEDTIDCTVNGERKYCCDLDKIEPVNWSSGLAVWAELYDVDSGFVTGRASVITSASAYDLFPSLSLSQPFTFVSDPDTILVDSSSEDFEISLHPSYNNFKVVVVNSGGTKEISICTNCDTASFTLDFLKGKNTVSFIAYGKREIVVTKEFFSVDYLDVDRKFVCPGCIFDNGDEGYVPSGKDVEVVLSVLSSHPIEGEFIEYVPSSWERKEHGDSIDFSDSHDGIVYFVNGSSFEAKYILKSPRSLLQKKYAFQSTFDDVVHVDTVSIRRIFWLYLPIYFSEKFSREVGYVSEKKQVVSNTEPYILVLENDLSELMILAVYPKEEGTHKSAITIKQGGIFRKKTEYELETDFRQNDIEKMYVQFKVPKGKELVLYQGDREISLDVYKEDEAFLYWEGYMYSKENFYTVVT